MSIPDFGRCGNKFLKKTETGHTFALSQDRDANERQRVNGQAKTAKRDASDTVPGEAHTGSDYDAREIATI